MIKRARRSRPLAQRRLTLTLCVTALLACLGGAPAVAADRQDVLRQARRAYYSLREQGLAEFRCGLQPNWETLLVELKTNDPAVYKGTLAKLNEIRFSMVLASNGSVRLTHNEVTGMDAEMDRGLGQIFGGMEQVVTGFFQTWSPFVLTQPFPEIESEYELEDQGSRYRLSYKEGPADIVTIMAADFAISDLIVVTPEFKSRLQPQFSAGPKGFLLNAYQADYRGSAPADATQLQVRIQYQEVQGLQLPSRLSLGGTQGGSPFQLELAFTGCRATRR